MGSGSGIAADGTGGLRLEDVLALTGQLEVRPLLHQILEVTGRIPGAGNAALVLLGAGGQPVETLGSAGSEEPAVSVVIRHGDQAYARLGVWSRSDEALTETAQEAVTEVAKVAEVAVGNARAYAASERRRDWVQATAELAETLHPPVRIEDTVAAIAGGVRRVARGSLAAVLVDSDQGYDVPATDGTGQERVAELVERLRPELARAQETCELVCLPGDGEGTVTLVPIACERFFGLVVLLIVDGGRGRLIPHVRELLASFAEQASLAIDRAILLQERQDAVVRADRERIGRDLHDVVIQRLFATGMRLQSTRHEDDPDHAQEHVDAAVAELELTIRDIRTTIFELQHERESSLRREIANLAREYAPALGFTPRVRTWGAVDSLVPRPLADHATAVLREALSNIARHASAHRCDIELSVGDGTLSLVVVDDGRGLVGELHESGLSNLRRRAEDLGGALDLETARPHGDQPRGTRLAWRVPLDA